MKPIYLLCLHNVRTGGPEAIHQLSDALIDQGFDARMVYYDWSEIAQLEQASPQSGYRFGERVNGIEEYFRYKTNVTDHVPNSPDCVVVLPETLCHLAPKFDKASVLVWWLSVDNGFGALSRINLNYLRTLRHAHQSNYALDFCRALGLKARPLGDYTAPLTELATPRPWSERAKRVAINANPYKVDANLDELMRRIGDRAQCVKIANFDRATIAHTFATSRAYIDLGSFPGRDRMPREAAHMGCRVLCSERGVSEYMFANYMSIPNLEEALEMPPPPYDIAAEKELFFTEAKALFSDL